MSDHEYLSELIQTSQQLTQELEKMHCAIDAAWSELSGEFVSVEEFTAKDGGMVAWLECAPHVPPTGFEPVLPP